MSNDSPSKFEAVRLLLTEVSRDLEVLEQAYVRTSQFKERLKGASASLATSQKEYDAAQFQMRFIERALPNAANIELHIRANRADVARSVENARTDSESKQQELAKCIREVQRGKDDAENSVVSAAAAWVKALRAMINEGPSRVQQQQTNSELRIREILKKIELDKHSLADARKRASRIGAFAPQVGNAQNDHPFVWRAPEALPSIVRERAVMRDCVGNLENSVKALEADLVAARADLEVCRQQDGKLEQAIQHLQALLVRAGSAASLEDIAFFEISYDSLTREFIWLASIADDERRLPQRAHLRVQAAQRAYSKAIEDSNQATLQLAHALKRERTETARLKNVEEDFHRLSSMREKADSVERRMSELRTEITLLSEQFQRGVTECESLAQAAERSGNLAAQAADRLDEPERFGELVEAAAAPWEEVCNDVEQRLIEPRSKRAGIVSALESALPLLRNASQITTQEHELLRNMIEAGDFKRASYIRVSASPLVRRYLEEISNIEESIRQLEVELAGPLAEVKTRLRVIASLRRPEIFGVDAACRDLDSVTFDSACRVLELRDEAKQLRDRVKQRVRLIGKLRAA
jgi:hypothetical protein